MRTREVPLSARHLATIASGIPDPETILLERESQAELEDLEEVDSVLPPEVREVLTEFLPLQEATLLDAHFLQELTQRCIADGLGRPKSSVQYRLRRALTRVRWALELETWNRSHEEIARDLGGIMGPDEVDFVVVLWENLWNQSHTAEWYGTQQSAVRRRVIKLHCRLLEHAGDTRVAPYQRDLSKITTSRAWCMGSSQVQGKRAIVFPKLRRA